MSERILRLLMELFAIAGRGSAEDEKARRKMEEDFLRLTLSQEKAAEFLEFYDKCILEFHNTGNSDEQENNRSSRISAIGLDLNEALTQKQKMIVIVRLIEYVFVASSVNDEELSFLNTIYVTLKIPKAEYELLFNLVTDKEAFSGDAALSIQSEERSSENIRTLARPGLQGEIQGAFVASAGMYFARYYGEQDLQLNGVPFGDGTVHIFSPGAIIRGGSLDPIYYADIERCFLLDTASTPIDYRVDNITYHFPNDKIGLHELSFDENGGRLIGIMGGSGAGKSTLLNVLNGNAKPSSGSVTINGVNLHTESSKLEGVVGFVSQSDLLIEDLTVFQNLYFNAQLCLDDSNDEKIREKVEQVLYDLGLSEAKDLKVGNPLEKIISGGQRKRLNIALELIREPGVLFLDEPTSGLSSSDSEVILDLLKSLALKGKLVFVVIHQPSSQIFKLFDKLIILDKGGYPVYQGNPVDAITYFKTATHRINPDISQCVCCGNVNPEQIFTILEARQIDDRGFPTGVRRVSPENWHTYYHEHHSNPTGESNKHEAFVSDYKTPGFMKQLGVFIKRDVLSKLNNRQYLLITILEAPVLAILLATMTLFKVPGSEYSFQSNRNIVAYVFMSVIVMLFLGLMTSAEEILSDRKIRQRERFLNLSKIAYLKSKIVILMTISAFQSLLFVVIGNSILEFREMYLEFWLMLFAVSLFANALGLNISSAFRNAVTIYILIPFLIIPQLMLSGLLVKFDELNPILSSRSVVPIAGEVMATRWAFEGLTVSLFKNNGYKKPLYQLEQKKEKLSYLSNYWSDEVINVMSAFQETTNKDSCMALLEIEFTKYGIGKEILHSDSIENGSSIMFMRAYKKKQRSKYDRVVMAIDAKLALDVKTSGNSNIWMERQSQFHNERIGDLVLSRDGLKSGIYAEYGQFHPGKNAAYFIPPPLRQIRSHFYAPQKYFMGRYYDTFWVNLIVIFVMTIGLYIMLYFEVLERFVAGFGKSQH